MKRIIRRPLALVVALGATLLAAGGIAWAAIPDSTGAINACYATSNGKLRAVDTPTDCGGGERAIALGGPTRAYSSHPPGTVVLGTTSSDLASLTLPAGQYASFSYPLSGLKEGFCEIFTRLLPESGYIQAPGPYFERYDEKFDPADAGSRVQICLPVTR